MGTSIVVNGLLTINLIDIVQLMVQKKGDVANTIKSIKKILKHSSVKK